MTSEEQSIVDVYGAMWCGDCHRAKAALERFGVVYSWYDIEHDENLARKAIEISGQKHIPVVVFSDGSFLVEPTANDLEDKLVSLGVALNE